MSSALVLSGGGANGAYEVGVVKALGPLRHADHVSHEHHSGVAAANPADERVSSASFAFAATANSWTSVR